MSSPCLFTTSLIVESSPETYELLTRTLTKLKENLTRLKYVCSVEEHSYICSSSETLVKIFPLPHGLEPRVVGEAYQLTIKVVITSVKPGELVQVNDLVAAVIKGTGLRYRRVD